MEHYVSSSASRPFKIAKSDRRFKGIVAASLQELREKAVSCLCISSTPSALHVYLAEDDTEVDDEEYFATLIANTKLYLKPAGNAESTLYDSTDGGIGVSNLGLERTESQEIRTHAPGRLSVLDKLSLEGVSRNIAVILTLSTDELNSFAETPLGVLVEVLRVDAEHGRVMLDAAMNEVQRREELIQASHLLSLYQRAKEGKSSSGLGSKRKKDLI